MCVPVETGGDTTPTSRFVNCRLSGAREQHCNLMGICVCECECERVCVRGAPRVNRGAPLPRGGPAVF